MSRPKANYKAMIDSYLREHGEGWVNAGVMGQALLGDNYTALFKSVIRSIRSQEKDGTLVTDGGNGRDMMVQLAEQAELTLDIRASSLEWEFELCNYLRSLEGVVEALWRKMGVSFGEKPAKPAGAAFAIAIEARVPAIALMKDPTIANWKSIPSERLPPSVHVYFEKMVADEKAAALAKIESIEAQQEAQTSADVQRDSEVDAEKASRAERDAETERQRQKAMDEYRKMGIVYDESPA